MGGEPTQVHRARAYGKQGNHPAAIACCQEAIALQPDCAEAYQVLGDVFQTADKPFSAEKAYEKALELAPHCLEVHYQLALLQQKRGDLHGAIARYQTLLALQPHLPEAHSNLGNLLAEVGQLDEAVACFQIALRLKPDYLKAHRNCGYILYLQGKLDEALPHFEQVLKPQPDCVVSLCHCARILLEKGNVKEAAQHFHHTLQQERSPFLPAYLTWVQQTEGVARERGEFLATLSEEPDAAPVYRFLGKFLSRTGNYEAAIAAFERSLTLVPEEATTHRLLADACAQVEQYDRAVSGYRQSLSLDPHDAETYFNFGVVLAQLDKRYEAIAHFQKAGELKPRYRSSTYDLGIDPTKQEQLNRALSDPDAPLPQPAPRKVWHTTRDWFEAYQFTETLADDCYRPVHPPHTLSLKPPQLFGGKLPSYFHLDALTSPATFVAVVPEGKAWVDDYIRASHYAGAIATADNELLNDVSCKFPIQFPGASGEGEVSTLKQEAAHWIESCNFFPPSHEISGNIAALAIPTSHRNYFHWMVDLLPRLGVLQASGFNLETIDYFYVNSLDLPFQQETLTTLEIPLEKVITVAEYPCIQATQLIVPSLAGHLSWATDWTCQFLRDRFLPTKQLSESPKRIYIRRGNAQSRQIVNEVEVIEFLQSYEFLAVTLEEMSVAEQATLFARAEVIIAPHGAGLTNLVFCSPGTKVIELCAPRYMPPFFWAIANRVGAEHYLLVGKQLSCSHLCQILYPDLRDEDYYIDPKDLVTVMQTAEVVLKEIPSKELL